jgi:hypothetical protein
MATQASQLLKRSSFMRTNAWKTVLIWSVASFGLTTAFLLPASLQADGPRQADTVSPLAREISTDHYTLSLKLADQKDAPANAFAGIPVDAGTTPKMKLEATNKTNVAITIPVKIQMQSAAPVSRMSRVPAIPKEIWSYQREITLAPGATDSVELISDAKLAAGSNVSILMTAGEKTVYPLRLAVKAAK